MVDGRQMLREVDIETNEKRIVNLPMVSDEDVKVQSYKYVGETLGEIIKKDREYIKWFILESKAGRRLKKSAARLFVGKPYTVPAEGTIISESELYYPEEADELIKNIK